MSQETSEDRLADLCPELDPTHLAVSRGPVGWRSPSVPDGFSALGHTDEVTLVCSEDQLASYDGATRQAVEVGRPPVTVAGPTSLSGFPTDHVLVRAAHADLAVPVLTREQPPEPRPGTTNP